VLATAIVLYNGGSIIKKRDNVVRRRKSATGIFTLWTWPFDLPLRAGYWTFSSL